MSCDKLVYDLSNQIEGSPNVFIRKDWLNILDNQNQNYQNNQSIIDTSQLSNSNKWMSYREGYLLMPMVLTMWGKDGKTGLYANTTASKLNVDTGFQPNYIAPTLVPVTDGQPSYDQTRVSNIIGLKNWFGSIIHSFTLDYNGTTIIQQTPFVNMWNSFKLLTTLSWGDIITQGPTIGFYPDTPEAFGFAIPSTALASPGTYNNLIYNQLDYPNLNINQGLRERIKWINFNSYYPLSPVSYANDIPDTAYKYGGGDNTGTDLYLTAKLACNQMWRTYISSIKNSQVNAPGGIQISISAIIYLKHIHSFFNMCPLLKGVFMKMTMNLNNASCAFNISGGGDKVRDITLVGAPQVPVGGVNPIMIAGFNVVPSISLTTDTAVVTSQYNTGLTYLPNGSYFVDLSVGAVPVSSTFQSNNGNAASFGGGRGSKSVYLYVPAYTFNPVFEQAYLSSPIKQIKYTDIYQYQVKNINVGEQFNNLVTNGIANIKSVLLIPFYSPGTTGNDNTGIGIPGTPVYQSPFDPAGTGNTSPLCHFNNFNIQISGQNAIYNTQRYTFEQFVNQLYGQNAVNGGLTDGLTSGLINFQGFTTSQCFYYINVERMLPVEQSVPKSVQILGTNQSNRTIDIMVFVEYGTDISIDALTGARV
jgi:hypothetical protein